MANVSVTQPRGPSAVMIKSELVQRVAAAHQHLYQRDVEAMVNAIFDEITAALARGDRVELRGFGAFTVKHREARVGRNPKTGEAVDVDEKFIPFFKTGKELRERLNKDFEPAPDAVADDDPSPAKRASGKAKTAKATKAAKPSKKSAKSS